MIDIGVTVDEHFATMEIKGHADYNPGNDIVCSAVSAISMTLVGATRAIGQLIEYKAESGDFMADITINRDSRVILNAIIIGLLQIEKTYPDHVKVSLVGIS